MTVKTKARRPVRRALVLLLTLLVFLGLYNVVLGYLPFAKCLEVNDLSAIEARVDAMMTDVDSPDHAAILESSDDALRERLRLIHQARRELILTTYDFRDGESTRDIMAVALERAEAGVKVRFLADGVRGRLSLMYNDLFRAMSAHPNVEIRFYNLAQPFQPWKHMGRMHDKYVIADDFAYILGGRNTYDEFLGSYPFPKRSIDREVLIYNEAHDTEHGQDSSLWQLRDYFETLWALPTTSSFEGYAPRKGRLESVYRELEERYQRLRREQPDLFEPYDYAAAPRTRGVWLISNPPTIYAKAPVAFETLCALMRRAKSDIVIHSPYAVFNDFTRARLTEVAARVPVRLMINAVENGNNVVASGDYLYHKGEVLSTGMRVLEYAGGPSYHGKSIAIDDDVSVVGSFNLDLRSTYVDTELMLLVRSPEINAQLRANFDALHADCREVIDLDTAVVPEGLEIRPLSPWRKALLRVIGAGVQLVRNLV